MNKNLIAAVSGGVARLNSVYSELKTEVENRAAAERRELERDVETLRYIMAGLQTPEGSTTRRLAEALLEDARREAEQKEPFENNSV